VQLAHLHSVHFQIRVFNCQQSLTKISFVIFDIVVKNKSKCGLAWSVLLSTTSTRHHGGQALLWTDSVDFLKALFNNISIVSFAVGKVDLSRPASLPLALALLTSSREDYPLASLEGAK